MAPSSVFMNGRSPRYSPLATEEPHPNNHRPIASHSSSMWSSSLCGPSDPRSKGGCRWSRGSLLLTSLTCGLLVFLFTCFPSVPGLPFPSPANLRFGPLNVSSWEDPHAVDSSRAVQLSRHEQVSFDRAVMQAQGLKLSVVFFMLVSARYEWRPLVTLMVNEVIEWGLAHSAELHFVVSVEEGSPLEQSAQAQLDECEDLIRGLLEATEPPLEPSLLSSVEVWTSLGNAFEYPGLARVWNLARVSSHTPLSRHVILYYHSKGMFNKEDTGKPFKDRSKKNWMLSQIVIRPWRSHLQRFIDDPAIRKVGHSISREGFVWMNFMFLRADYVRLLVRPRRMENRYWHEWWASMLDPDKSPQCRRNCSWGKVKWDETIDEVEADLFPCSGADTPDLGNMGHWCWAGPGHSWPAAAGAAAYSGKIIHHEDWQVLDMHGNASLNGAAALR